jgi:hypothetical protein
MLRFPGMFKSETTTAFPPGVVTANGPGVPDNETDSSPLPPFRFHIVNAEPGMFPTLTAIVGQGVAVMVKDGVFVIVGLIVAVGVETIVAT